MWPHIHVINGLHTNSRAVSPAQQRETLFPHGEVYSSTVLLKTQLLSEPDCQGRQQSGTECWNQPLSYVQHNFPAFKDVFWVEPEKGREKKEKEKPICSKFWWVQANKANFTQGAVELLGKIQSTRKDCYVNEKTGGTKISSTFLCKNQCSRVYFHESGNTTATFFSGND